MKKLLLSIFALALSCVGYAQMNLEAINPDAVASSSLSTFTSIDIIAPMIIRLERVDSPEECKIKYDLKGVTDSKFNFEVKDSVLYIRERVLFKRTSISEAVIYYHDLKSLTVSRAKVSLSGGAIKCSLFDLKLLTESVFVGGVECDDLKVSAQNRSRATLSGSSKYVTVEAISSGVADLQNVSSVAAWVSASNGATVEVAVSERLDVKSSAGAVVKYHGNPSIVRSQKPLIGGEVFQIDTLDSRWD
ncbi:MAG: DUF2807 domain-containing protein [Rikenellaceae bacterium]